MGPACRKVRLQPAQQGVSLAVVMMVLLVVSVAGIAAARLALLGEASARNDRDKQIAFQAAEAALIDAENEIDGVGASGCTSLRTDKFLATQSVMAPGSCGTSAAERGLCMPAASSTSKPTWAAVDFLDQSGTAPTVAYGSYTCRSFDAGAGVKAARVPRYLIERVPDKTPGQAPDAVIYRITAMGFGPRVETRSVLQVEYRKKDVP